MRLIEELEKGLGAERSMFRAQLLREDIGRLRRVCELAAASPDRAALLAAVRRLGWTQGDARTHEIAYELEGLVDAVLAWQRDGSLPAAEAPVRKAWEALTSARVERLVGCLATRVPRPQ